MISERTLKKWRIDALNVEIALEICSGDEVEMELSMAKSHLKRLSRIVLNITQVLLDQHLLKK